MIPRGLTDSELDQLFVSTAPLPVEQRVAFLADLARALTMPGAHDVEGMIARLARTHQAPVQNCGLEGGGLFLRHGVRQRRN